MNTQTHRNNANINHTYSKAVRILGFVVVAGILSAISFSFAGETDERVPNASIATDTQPIEYQRLILMKFVDGATDADIEKVKQRFCALGRTQPGLEEAIWAEDKDLCPKSEYTHAVILRFSCPKAAATYRENKACKAFEAEASSTIASMLEMKYEVNAENRSGPTV